MRAGSIRFGSRSRTMHPQGESPRLWSMPVVPEVKVVGFNITAVDGADEVMVVRTDGSQMTPNSTEETVAERVYRL